MYNKERTLALIRADMKAMEAHIRVLRMAFDALKGFDGQAIAGEVEGALGKMLSASGEGGQIGLARMPVQNQMQLWYRSEIQESYNDGSGWRLAEPLDHKQGYVHFTVGLMPAQGFGYLEPRVLNAEGLSAGIEEAVARYSGLLEQYRHFYEHQDAFVAEYNELATKIDDFARKVPSGYRRLFGYPFL